MVIFHSYVSLPEGNINSLKAPSLPENPHRPKSPVTSQIIARWDARPIVSPMDSPQSSAMRLKGSSGATAYVILYIIYI